MNLVFKEFGTVLGGRELAEKIRKEIEDSSDLAVLDFADVRTVSHSFADELIGKLAAKYGAEAFRHKIKIINLSESNKLVFSFVISERQKKAA
jgi:hypothetical protein